MFRGIYRGRRVLVTGHTGFKGSWLSQWLLHLGAEVAGLSNGIPTEPSNFEVLGLSSRLKHYLNSVTDLDAVGRVFSEWKPEIVFHLAAQALLRRAYDQPRLTFETNVMGTINVLEAIRRTRSVKAAVFITSDKCYENVEWSYGYRETDRLGGKDPYSASKACAEIAFSAYARSYFAGSDEARIATTRAGNVIGGGDWASDRIVPDCIRAWSRGETAVIRSPSATRPWQHVLEPLSGYLWLGSKLFERGDNLASESFNFGPDAAVNHSVRELIQEMQKSWRDGRWRVEENTDGRKEASLLKLSCDKVLHVLRWRPTLSFEETVAMTAGWYQRYYGRLEGMGSFAEAQIKEYERLGLERERIWAKQNL